MKRKTFSSAVEGFDGIVEVVCTSLAVGISRVRRRDKGRRDEGNRRSQLFSPRL
jgi:hypothetical protein